MSGPDGRVFLDGAHAAEPTVETGSGEFRFDQSTWAEAFGLSAAGDITVRYDNRVGVDLELFLDEVSYPDARDTCTGQPVAGGVVVLGPAQRYVWEGESGDYQLVASRGHGCRDLASSRVRVRWNAGGGRADSRIHTGTSTRWEWSQCWRADGGPGALVYEHLRVRTGIGAGEVRIDIGNPAACVYADFGEVNADVVAGR